VRELSAKRGPDLRHLAGRRQPIKSREERSLRRSGW
jgi:hypothetical protein